MFMTMRHFWPSGDREILSFCRYDILVVTRDNLMKFCLKSQISGNLQISFHLRYRNNPDTFGPPLVYYTTISSTSTVRVVLLYHCTVPLLQSTLYFLTLASLQHSILQYCIIVFIRTTRRTRVLARVPIKRVPNYEYMHRNKLKSD